MASTTSTVEIDGVLDEPVWATAEPVTEFIQYAPDDGGPPPGSTEIRFAQDERYLYIGVRVTGVDYPLRARLSPREDINDDDQIGVYLDTFRDERSGYIFYFNPLGIQQDARFHAGSWNGAWDTVLRSEGHVTDDGFVLEVAIPFRSLKYPAVDGDQEWGLILTRKIPDTGAKYGWPPLERGHPQLFAQARPLRGVRPPHRSSGLELLPSLTAIQGGTRESTSEPLEWNGLTPWTDALRPALDARIGLTRNFGLTTTVNPNFSQVESDTTPTNLNQRFATWFPERRPFFLEDAGYLSDSMGTLYSRSVVDPVYGVKVAGQKGPVAVGVLHALDRTPAPSIHEHGSPGFTEDQTVDAIATNTLARVRADVGQGWLGVTTADKRILDRSLSTTRGAHDSLGADLYLPLQGRWVLSSHADQSWTRGARAHLQGQELFLNVRHNSGPGWGGHAAVQGRTTGYRRELGYLAQTGFIAASAHLDHTWEPGTAVDTFRPRLDAYANRFTDGAYVISSGLSSYLLVRGRHHLWAWANLNQRREEDVVVNGGDAGVSWWGDLTSAVAVGPSGNVGQVMDFDTLSPATTGSTALTLRLRPTSALRLDLTGRYELLDPANAPREWSSLVRSVVRWQFTRPLGLRVIVEHSQGTELDPALLSSVLLHWLHHPGTAAWLGFTELTSLDGTPAPLERTVFAKVSVLLRP